MFNPLLPGRLSLSFRPASLKIFVVLLLVGLLIAQLQAQTANRIKAPELDGAVGPTLGSDKPLRLKDLRGKIVVLDFWTMC